MEKVGVAIIGPGTGKNGFGLGKYIINEVLSNSRASLVAISSTSYAGIKRNLQEIDSQLKIFPLEIIENIFKLNEVDLVIIASPDHSHLSYLDLAVKYGKHVLVEKPIIELTGKNEGSAKLAGIFNAAQRQNIYISTNCQRAFIPQFLGIQEVKNSIRIEIGIGKKQRDISEDSFVKLVISHPVSILVKLGLDNIKLFSSIYISMSTEHKNLVQLNFEYDKKIRGVIILRQYDIECPADIKLSIDSSDEIRAVAEKTGDIYRTKYESNKDVSFGSDLLAHSIQKMIEAVYSKEAEPVISNKDSYNIYEIQEFFYSQYRKSIYDQKLSPLSVFMPLYNSGQYIKRNIEQTYTFIEANFIDFELILVDDNSKDDTIAIVSEMQALYPKLKVIKNSQGPSKRENLAKAMTSAGFDYVFFQDQDLPVPLGYILPLVGKIIYEEYDIAIGSRYLGPKPKRSLYRLLLSKAFNFILNIFFKTKLRDHICGFKAYKKEKLLMLLKEMGYDHSAGRGWFWDAELLIRAEKNKMTVYEMPVEWVNNQGSTFRLRNEFGMIKYIFKFYKRFS
jgi:hypothetical protein